MEEAGWRVAPKQAARQEIDQMREAIDALDQTIATLLAQRLALSGQIGALKAGSDIAVKDNRREQQVLANVRSVSANPQVGQALANIYGRVLEESCALQTVLKQAAPDSQPQPTPITSTCYFPRVLIVGLGMVGGAMAQQIKRLKPETTVSAIDRADVLERAVADKVIDRAEPDLNKAVARAGLIILCATPAENMRILAQIAPLTKRRQVIMDVTSTKQEICQLAETTSMRADFIGGHPLFGTHKSGLQPAADVVVDGQRFCLVRTERSSELTLRRLSRWLSDLNLRVLHSSAQQHDQALARTSHNVQLLATAVGSALARGRTDDQLRGLLSLSGPSLQSLTRLMASPADMWLEILKQNKSEVCAALTELIEELRATRLDISCDNEELLRARFEEAGRLPALTDR